MIEKIKHLAHIARQLEPSQQQRQQWEGAVQQYAHRFLNAIEQLNAYNPSDHEGRAISDLPIGEQPHSMDELLQLLWENVDQTGINPASGRHLGYIPGGGIYSTAIADYLAAVTNRFAGFYFANPGAVRLENKLIRWLCELAGYPDSAHGNLTSGGSIANLTAIVTARDKKGIKASEVERAVIYLTRQVHHCVQKAIRIAGLGEVQIRYVAIDERFRMDAAALRQQVELDKQQGLRPFLVVASAGTTDVGAIDPLDAIADVAEEHGLWYHVDGAYGGAFLLVEEETSDGAAFKNRFKGIERSDSLAIDPHKGLFLSYGLGAILIKDVQAAYDSHFYKAGYMQDAQQDFAEWSSADLSPELTKHFRGLRLWLSLQLFGIQPFRAALAEKIELCRYFYEKVQELGFEVGSYPELSVTIYRYIPENEMANEFNRRLLEAILQDGRFFISSTTIDGTYWLRLAILSFRTHLQDIEDYLKFLKHTVQRLQEQQTVAG